jgi:carboxylesterase type B
MIGSMRDDGSPFSKFSSSSNASQALKEQGFDAAKILGSKEFPLPQSGNVTKDIFNLTSRVATDAMFRCSGQATAMAGTKNGIFPVVYAYEIDRGYQISEWSPNFPACETPNTAERPFGDTRLPYMRCHSGELYSVFGTLVRQGRQPRDEDDIPFSQLLVDTWSAFAREKDPSPDPAFLSARDYTNTSATLERATQWKPLDLRKPGIRVLNVEPKDESLREVEQCAILGIPLNYYSN